MLALVLVAAGLRQQQQVVDRGRPSTTTAGGAARVIDSLLVFGGPPECLERPLCLGAKVATGVRPEVQGSEEARRRRPDHVEGA